MATVTEEKKKLVAVLPFVFEATGKRMEDLLIQCIPGCRMRSAIDGMAPVIDFQGQARVPLDQAKALASFPRTPGMQLHVDPGSLEYEIIDPLHNNERMLEQVNRYFREQGNYGISDSINGVPPKKGKLDQHRMKSLCRELYNIVQVGDGKLEKGALTMADIEDLPGRFLLNPGSQVPNTQPVYEDELDSWVDNLSRTGG